MSEDAHCLIGVLAGLATLVYIVLLFRGTPRLRLFKSPRHVIAEWRRTRSLSEKLLLLALLTPYIFGGGAYALAVAVVAAAVSIGASLCGIRAEELEVVRKIINDVLNWIGRMMGRPVQQASEARLYL